MARKKIKAIAKRAAAFALAAAMAIAVFTTVDSENAYAAGYKTVKVKVKYGQTEARKVTKLVNDFRTGNPWYWNSRNTKKVKAKGLKKLKYDYGLEKVAMQRAAEIAIKYSHQRPNGKMCFSAYDALKVDANPAGENIAYGMNMMSTAKVANSEWREDKEKYNGQGHRRNMLGSQYTGIGVAHVIVGSNHYWVEEFGTYSPRHKKTSPCDSSRKVKVTVNSSRIIKVDKKKYVEGDTIAWYENDIMPYEDYVILPVM